MAEFEARHVDAIQQLVEKEKIDCELTVTDAIDVQLSATHAQCLKVGFDQLVASGCEPTKTTRYIGPADAEKVFHPAVHHNIHWLIVTVFRYQKGCCMLHLPGRASLAI